MSRPPLLVRVARFSIAHRRSVIAFWIVLLICSIGLAGGLKNQFDNNLTLPNTDAQRATALLQAGFPSLDGDSDQIVFHTTRGKLDSPPVRFRITTVLRTVSRLPHVTRVTNPYTTRYAVSADGATGFATVNFNERGDALPAAATKRVIATAQSARSGTLQVALGGNAIEQAQKPSLGAATLVGILAAMVVLYLSFGSLTAMALPIVTALFGLGVSSGLIAALTHTLNTPNFATELALLIGLGVGIDYALFLVTRFRDAYRQSNDTNTAIELAMNTAGRSVLFAGATVVIAILGLFIVGVQFLYGVALATSFTVVLVLAATLTLLPAMLSLTGKRVTSSRRARRRESREAQGENRAWLRWVAAIQRRPALWALASTAVLVVLAAPLVELRLAASDAANDAPSTTTYQAYQLLSNGFGPGFNGPLSLAIQLPKPARSTTTLTRLTAALQATPGIASVSKPVLDPAGTTAEITVYPTTAPDSKSTYDLVKHLPSAIIPPVAQATGATVYVGGFTASQVDFAHVLSGKLPYFIGIVIALSALLLLVVFRSLLIPLQAAVMNVLSIAAALGVVQAIFERGWGAGLLGITRSPIQAFLPVIAFAIIFGLSMDYEVFLVSRVHEEWVHGADHTTAVRNGIARTGRVITAAAAVMVVVFGSFAASNNHILKLFGLTLAVAVFLDAIVIRTILLPATLQLFGPKTWALPRWIDRRLPRLALEPPLADPRDRRTATLAVKDSDIPGAA
jgi:putative drug exporter of the RND superfamily